MFNQRAHRQMAVSSPIHFLYIVISSLCKDSSVNLPRSCLFAGSGLCNFPVPLRGPLLSLNPHILLHTSWMVVTMAAATLGKEMESTSWGNRTAPATESLEFSWGRKRLLLWATVRWLSLLQLLVLYPNSHTSKNTFPFPTPWACCKIETGKQSKQWGCIAVIFIFPNLAPFIIDTSNSVLGFWAHLCKVFSSVSHLSMPINVEEGHPTLSPF